MPGRDLVRYTLTEEDAEAINRRRTTGESIVHRLGANQWHEGAQAHIGNRAYAGDIYPMVIVRAWGPRCVNGQVFLDGTDTLWVTSVYDGGPDTPGTWHF